MFKIKFALSISILLSATSVNANTLDVTYLNKYLKCTMIGNNLQPTQEAFSFKNLKGTSVGYTVKKGFPVAKLLIPNDEQNQSIYISNTPKLRQTKKGCLISFFITSPAGYTLYEPSKKQKFHQQAKYIPAQLAKSQD
ncbi:hypothetical protein [Pseudoalteromonas marina]|uniref:Uncharacterized protein n=1 Tax=Pseudoalteromonas marina TaxID=267375 RepID=A0ABT9FBX6_9GAMM|nr:hypothetical protein [Pseudoalteromonas marina]MDP2564289.1 hypothetical protein [Pseudoalteromonas marina]